MTERERDRQRERETERGRGYGTAVSQYFVKNQHRHKMIAYTGCHRRKGPNFGRVFLMLNYTDITQNTYIQSSMVTEILAREV